VGGELPAHDPPGIGLGLAHPEAKRLSVDAEIARDRRDRAVGLEHEPDRSLA
jgi:hypothetical protein